MPVPAVVGDLGSLYTFPSSPPVVSSFAITAGATTVFFNGAAVAVLPGTQTAGGSIISSTLLSTKVFVEGLPIILGGASTNLGTGWLNGTIVASNAVTVQVN